VCVPGVFSLSLEKGGLAAGSGLLSEVEIKRGRNSILLKRKGKILGSNPGVNKVSLVGRTGGIGSR